MKRPKNRSKSRSWQKPVGFAAVVLVGGLLLHGDSRMPFPIEQSAPSETTSPSADSSEGPLSQESPAIAEVAAAESNEESLIIPVPVPLKVGLLFDRSGSVQDPNASPSIDQLQPLANALAERGGELAVGSICNHSDQPLDRSGRVPELPPLEITAITESAPPEPVDEHLPGFQKREAQLLYEAQLADSQRVRTENAAVIAAYEAADVERQQQAETQLMAFLTTLQPMLEPSGVCSQTDLYSALARSQYFLEESADSWHQAPRKFLIVVSDGLQTIDRSPVSLDSDIDVLVVGPQPEGSIFHDFKHQPFESLEAAIAHVIAVREEG